MCHTLFHFILGSFNTTHYLAQLPFFTSLHLLTTVFTTTDTLFECSKEGTVARATIRTRRSRSFCLHFALVAEFGGLFHVKETVSKLRFS